jgi:hypothetical protein
MQPRPVPNPNTYLAKPKPASLSLCLSILSLKECRLKTKSRTLETASKPPWSPISREMKVRCGQSESTRETQKVKIRPTRRKINTQYSSRPSRTREFSLSCSSIKKRAPRIHYCREISTPVISRSRSPSLIRDLEALAIVSTSFKPMVRFCPVPRSGRGLISTRPTLVLSLISKKPTSTSARAQVTPPSKTQIFSKAKPEEHPNNPEYKQINGQTSRWTTVIVPGRKQTVAATAWFAPRGDCSWSSSNLRQVCVA